MDEDRDYEDDDVYYDDDVDDVDDDSVDADSDADASEKREAEELELLANQEDQETVHELDREILGTVYDDASDFQKVMGRRDERNTTKPVMTKYEKAKVVGVRAAQLSHGAKPMIEDWKGKDPIAIAEAELEKGVCPLLIQRPLPNGTVETFKLRDLYRF